MELRRELLLTIGALVFGNLLLAFGAIGLLSRMAPAIDRILVENVFSIESAEEILSEFAKSADRVLTPEAQKRVRKSMTNAKRNVTERAEHQVIVELDAELEAAMAGNVEAQERLVGHLGHLIRINREAMGSAGEEAERLGRAGAWAAVLVGFISFVMSLTVVARLEKRLLRPLLDLYQVLDSAQQGNRLRRCRLADAPKEVASVTQLVNALLDERLQFVESERRSR